MTSWLPSGLGQLETIEAAPNPRELEPPPAYRGYAPGAFPTRPTFVFFLSSLSFLTILRWQIGDGHAGLLMLVEQAVGVLALFIEVVCRDPIGLGYFGVTALMGGLLDLSRCMEKPLPTHVHSEQAHAAGISQMHLQVVCAAVQFLCALAAWKLYRETEAEVEMALLVAEELMYGSIARDVADARRLSEPTAQLAPEQKPFTGLAMKIQ
mmetsp:Transcript_17530/g.40811  ORF Transcript_17530/g.40811 Transcript_17530/m.40811 type:complete len:209 (-) Transcript_17530:64-690(-)